MTSARLNGHTWHDITQALASHPGWEQQIPPETEALGIPRREAWMHITAYLVPATTTELRGWAQGKDWFGRWMPKVLAPHRPQAGEPFLRASGSMTTVRYGAASRPRSSGSAVCTTPPPA